MNVHSKIFLLAVVGVALMPPAQAATWVGGNGAYGVPANWSPVGIPCFEITPVAHDVVIDVPSAVVDQDVPGCSVASLTLGAGIALRLQGGTVFSASQAELSGRITGLGGDLDATGAAFAGTGARINATAGSAISVDAASLDATGVPVAGVALLSAIEAGSSLSLPMLASIDGAFNSVNASVQEHLVLATDSASLDLSGLATVSLPGDPEDRIRFEVHDGASLALDSLSLALGGGQVFLVASDGGSLDLPSLSELTAGRFLASSGGQINAGSSAWILDSSGLFNNNYTLIEAVDAGSVLDLSGLTFIDASFNSVNSSVQAHRIVVSSAASIDLSGLLSVVVPADREDRLAFEVSASGQLILDSLASASGGGQVFFTVTDGGALTLPALSDLSAGRFFASSGGLIDASGSNWTLDSSALLNNNYTLLSATGTGSTLDLSGLASIDASFNSLNGSAQTHTIIAGDGGHIDLSGLVTATLPADREDRLWFDVTGTATLDLSALQAASGSGHVVFNVTNGGALDLPALTVLSAGRFFVSDGSQVTAAGAAWQLNSAGLNNNNYDLIIADDPGTVVDLSAMTLLNAGFNSANGAVQRHSVSADAGALVDLSGVEQIVAPLDAEDLLIFNVSDGATLRLGPLASVSNPGRVFVNLAPSGSTLAFPHSANVAAQVGVVSSADSDVRVTGDLSFAHDDESQFDLETARVSVVDTGSPRLEVGGADEGTTPVTSPNFGFAQLIVGSATQTTTARLVDSVDNGNGFSLCSADGEALYLYGFDAGPEDGLRVLNGSTLDLGGVNLYASVGGVLMHVNPMLTPGVPFPWDEGFLVGGNPADSDADGVPDSADNCVLAANPGQEDTDADGFGNACDADLDGDLSVNSVDLGELKMAFFSSPGSPDWNPDADFNADGFVNPIDLGIMKALFFQPPGPSCVAAP